ALTGQGVSLLATADRHVQNVQPEILKGLKTEERAKFIAMLRKITMAGNERSRAPLIAPQDESAP
ncbi:MAG: hypothetical protein COC12_01805, partial [Rhodobacteraceae bacterium]